jgi:hypothetical protein
MNIKIEGGTAEFGQPSLCLSCRSATVVRGASEAHQLVKCSHLEAQVTFTVTSCSQYVHKNHPSIWDMEEIAWVLKTDPKRKQIGFVRPGDSGRRVVIDD